MDITYPIPPSKTRDGEVKHPYFSFQVPGQAGTTEFQWQIHPVENGSLRYTLVRIPQSGAADGQGSEVQKVEVEAIYYHIGVGASLSLPYSEGVLLLRSPSFADAGAEALVVGSMLGMLWRLRELDEDGKGKKSRFSGLKGLMKGK